jgi:RNA polymerase sigma factor (sigma-70 family)
VQEARQCIFLFACQGVICCTSNLVNTIPDHIDEPVLIRQLKARDRQALTYLYDHYSGALYGVILRVVQDEEIAQELLQDAFLKIWNQIGLYNESRGRLFTWMFQLARNLAIDKVRSRSFKEQQKTDTVESTVSKLDRQHHSESFVDGIGLDKVLDSLSGDQRLIVELLYLKGYTQAEVAEEYGIPLGTVKTRHRAAMMHLRKQIGT